MDDILVSIRTTTIFTKGSFVSSANNQELCPCCFDDLKLQSGFSGDLPFWNCRVRGEMLINPDLSS